MLISSKDFRAKSKEQWTKLRPIWLRNKYYITPTPEELEEVVSQYIVDLPVIPGFNECENFALYLHSAVKMHRAKLTLKKDEQYNWAFGDFICQKDTFLQGFVPHTACICLTTDGFRFIEPMEENRILKPNKDYGPFFVNLFCKSNVRKL